jgi:uncharacterized membrane protein YccC
VILFNLIAPAGWRVGLVRIEDVAIGCAVSLVVGIVLWPRGAAAVVGDDLADAFRRGSAYLREAVDWALGARQEPPDTGMATMTAGLRLDDGLRGYLTEQGAKKMTKEDLWNLVLAAMRLRLAANSLAGLPDVDGQPPYSRDVLGQATDELTGFYEQVADQVGQLRGASQARRARRGSRGDRADEPVKVPSLAELDSGPRPLSSGGPAQRAARALWVREHLRHLHQHAHGIPVPAAHMAEARRTPWWR